MKISICLPIYNGEKFLIETLNSINNQSFKDFELIISDDKSNDFSLEIVNNFLKQNSQIQNKVIINRNRGIGENWNNCLRHSSGKFVKFIFQDDILYPSCLEEMCLILENNKNIGLVASKREFLIEKDNNINDIDAWVKKYKNLQYQFESEEDALTIIDKKIFNQDWFLSSPLNKIGEPSTVMFRKKLINEIGYFRTDLLQILDYEYWNRILKNNKICVINKPLVSFRIHNKQATVINRNTNINENDEYHKILYQNYFWLLNNSDKKQMILKYNPIVKLLLKYIKS